MNLQLQELIAGFEHDIEKLQARVAENEKRNLFIETLATRALDMTEEQKGLLAEYMERCNCKEALSALKLRMDLLEKKDG